MIARAALLTILGLALAGVPAARADDYASGQVLDGYTYRDGFWWQNGYAHQREAYTTGGGTYCYNGRWYATAGVTAYRYNRVPVATKTEYVKEPAPAVTYADPDWRVKLLAIAEQRDKIEGTARKAAAEQRYFLEGVKALGLEGNFRLDGYGTSPYPGGGYGYGYAVPTNGIFTHSLQYGLFGVNGSTVYGAGLKSVLDPYADSNLATLYQQAQRLAEGSQKLAGDATSQFGGLVQQEGANRARVAEILARGAAAEKLLQSIDGPPRTETQTFEFRAGGNRPPIPKAEPEAEPKRSAPNGSGRAAFEAAWKADCAKCHTGSSARGKFTLAAYDAMTPAQKRAVVALLVSPDADRMMPRAPGGGPGRYLSAEKVRLFMDH